MKALIYSFSWVKLIQKARVGLNVLFYYVTHIQEVRTAIHIFANIYLLYC